MKHIFWQCLTVIISRFGAFVSTIRPGRISHRNEAIKACVTFLSRNSGEQWTSQFSANGFPIEEVVYFFLSWLLLNCSNFRLNLMLETIRSLPSASAITPTFDHMAVDTSWERKVLKKVTWLQIPGKCFLTGGERDFAFGTEKNLYPPLLFLLKLWRKEDLDFKLM